MGSECQRVSALQLIGQHHIFFWKEQPFCIPLHLLQEKVSFRSRISPRTKGKRWYLGVVLISIPLIKKRVFFHMFMCFMFLCYLYIDFYELSDYAFCSVFNQVCGLSLLLFKRILYIMDVITTYIRVYSIKDIYLSIIYFIHIILIFHAFSFSVCFLLCLH